MPLCPRAETVLGGICVATAIKLLVLVNNADKIIITGVHVLSSFPRRSWMRIGIIPNRCWSFGTYRDDVDVSRLSRTDDL